MIIRLHLKFFTSCVTKVTKVNSLWWESVGVRKCWGGKVVE